MMVNSLHLFGISQQSNAESMVLTSNDTILCDVMIQGSGIRLELLLRSNEERNGNARDRK
jgi:hypothetical protein